MSHVDYRGLFNKLDQKMDSNIVDEVHESLLNGFIDEDIFSAVGDFGPKLLTNQHGNAIWNQLKQEMLTCQEYTFAVAFITDAMISILKPKFKELKKKGTYGHLITSNYLFFNKPEVFRELLKIPNLEVRIADVKGFHQKGYVFKHHGYQTIIVGSANLTPDAMLRNYEWSMQINSLNNGYITKQISDNISDEWREAEPLSQQWISDYEHEYHLRSSMVKPLQKEAQEGQPHYIGKTITPNRMQKDALEQISLLRKQGKDRGLVISATGTGKTYLGAFDAKNARPKRMLFLAHREQILQNSKKSFKKILGGADDEFGLYTGNSQDINSKYLFATVQTLSKDENLAKFSPSDFDYILIDEVHHAGASSYQKVMKYFHPKFFLGMTATPERNDDFNVFKLFEYNVAYEIRLQKALDEDMLCPFHYVGITDYQFADSHVNKQISDFNNEVTKKHKNEKAVVDHLTSSERVKYILEQTNYYGYSGDVLHGLIFCSTVNESNLLAEELTRQGYPAKALSGKDSMDKRLSIVELLKTGKIKYIVTVDVFNEGIDIPCINQVVFLRNTNSSIVYIQQLGRGLRKYPGKDYVEIIDFIGNYKNNYMIPIALTGDSSFSKDSARDTIDIEPTFGISTISFDEISKEKIYQSLQKVKLDDMRKLREVYQNTKFRVGRIPLLEDFFVSNSVDPVIIATKKKNYAQFLMGLEDDIVLTNYENKLMTFIDEELLNGKRRQELLLLQMLLDNYRISGTKFKKFLDDNKCLTDESTIASVRRVLDLTFYNEKAFPTRDSYGGQPIVYWNQDSDIYTLNSNIIKSLNSNEWFARLWKDAIKTGLLLSQRYQPNQQFTIGEKYTRKDVMRLSNNKKNITAQNIGGYYFNENDGMIFVTYHKAKTINKSIQYNDHFINDHVIKYYSQSNRKLESTEIKKFIDGHHRLMLFVKKSDADDSTTFYYLGTCKYVNQSAQQEELDNKPIVSMKLELDFPVEFNRYRALTC